MTVLSQVAYPIIWWVLLVILDLANFRKWGSSLIRSNFRFFAAIVLPFSSLYWLYFELVNYVFPQWRYLGIINNLSLNAILSFISFATVIPAIVELFWFFNGPEFQLGIAKNKFAVLAFGLLTAITPFISENFWLNQIVWIAPFLIFSPFLDSEKFNKKVFWYAVLTGLLSGFLWEFLNFWVKGKWEYLILKDVPHIFEMPIVGYLGFIPFAFSTLAVYLFAKKFFEGRLWLSPLLYLMAIASSYLFAQSLVA